MTIDLKGVVIKPTHHHLLPVLKQLRLTKDKSTFRFQLASLLFESVNTYPLDADTTKVFQVYKTNRAITLKQLQDLGITIGLDFINKPLLALLASSKVIQYTEGTLENISPNTLLEELLEPINKELECLMHRTQKDYERDVSTGLLPEDTDGDYVVKSTPSDFDGEEIPLKVMSGQTRFDSNVKHIVRVMNNIRIGMTMDIPTEYNGNKAYLLNEISQLPKPLLKRVFDLQERIKAVTSRESLIGHLMDYIATANVDTECAAHQAKVVEFKPKKKN